MCFAEDGVKEVSGCLGATVHLPCACSHNLDEEFTWQMDEPREIPVLEFTNNQSYFGDSYEGRATMFLHENSKNCSVLLANITAADQGKYRCSFYDQKRYRREFVYLNVTGPPACDTTVVCDGCTPTNKLHESYPENFSSTAATGRIVGPVKARHRYFQIIPLILALGMCLVLWRRWKSLYSRSVFLFFLCINFYLGYVDWLNQYWATAVWASWLLIFYFYFLVMHWELQTDFSYVFVLQSLRKSK